MSHKIIILYFLNTLIFIFPLYRQFMIIAKSDDDDPEIIFKVGFLIFNLSILSAMWLCYFQIRDAAWYFFLIAILISFFTYYRTRSIWNAIRKRKPKL
jgi:hypothetical protein